VNAWRSRQYSCRIETQSMSTQTGGNEQSTGLWRGEPVQHPGSSRVISTSFERLLNADGRCRVSRPQFLFTYLELF
jgi:hypothetical protein